MREKLENPPSNYTAVNISTRHNDTTNTVQNAKMIINVN